MDIKETGYKRAEWTHLAQDRDQYLAFVNTVMNIRFRKRHGIS
jgi:hypothetical protein